MNKELGGSAIALFALALFAQADDVKDGGGFFKPEAIKQADALIKEIKDKHRLEVIVESFAAPPDDRLAQFKKADQKGKEKVLEDWAISRVGERKLHGFFLLLCRKPPYIRLLVDKDMAQKVFKDDDYKQFMQDLIGRFRKSQYDEGLTAGLTFLRDRVEANSKK